MQFRWGLITAIDGPTSSDKGLLGPVYSLLPKVNEIAYNSSFGRLPRGQELITFPEEVLGSMSTVQMSCCNPVHRQWKLVIFSSLYRARSVPSPPRRVAYHRTDRLPVDQTAWTGWENTEHPGSSREVLFGVLLQVVGTLIWFHVDASYHILTCIRILKTQPKKVKDAVTFYVRENWSLVLPLRVSLHCLASSDPEDRFAVKQVLQLTANAVSTRTRLSSEGTPPSWACRPPRWSDWSTGSRTRYYRGSLSNKGTGP